MTLVDSLDSDAVKLCGSRLAICLCWLHTQIATESKDLENCYMSIVGVSTVYKL